MKAFITFISALLFYSLLSAQTKKAALTITHLTGDFYVYTTYNEYKGTAVPSNGLYLVTNAGVVIIDSPWDTTQFQPLLDSIQIKHHQKAVICIATHSHEDRTAALEYYKQKGIKTYTTKQTDAISKQGNKKRAEFLMSKDTVFKVGQYSFQTFYAGQGHTPDNIVIWFEKDKILHGGCLIKSIESTDLGYTGEANTKEWPATIKHIQRKFKEPHFIIPGHGEWLSKESLNHTLKLLEQYKQKNLR